MREWCSLFRDGRKSVSGFATRIAFAASRHTSFWSLPTMQKGKRTLLYISQRSGVSDRIESRDFGVPDQIMSWVSSVALEIYP